MTRAHFEFIASVIRAAAVTALDRLDLASATARRLEATNARFDSARFIEACFPEAITVPKAGK